jgi:hypothetical protein
LTSPNSIFDIFVLLLCQLAIQLTTASVALHRGMFCSKKGKWLLLLLLLLLIGTKYISNFGAKILDPL